jgi:hypothetical protein
MSKYEVLSRFLRDTDKSKLNLKFSEIERILGTPLPASARRYPAWWSNNRGSHVQAHAWLDSGFRTEQVDVAAETLSFVASHPLMKPSPELSEPPTPVGLSEGNQHRLEGYPTIGGEQGPLEPIDDGKTDKKPYRHPAWGALAGMITLLPDVDLTEPSDPDWGKLDDE